MLPELLAKNFATNQVNPVPCLLNIATEDKYSGMLPKRMSPYTHVGPPNSVRIVDLTSEMLTGSAEVTLHTFIVSKLGRCHYQEHDVRLPC